MSTREPTETSAISEAIRALASGRDLTSEEMESALLDVMGGRASDVQKSALLLGLRARGETADEVIGGVRALRKAMIGIAVTDPDRAVDTCGTGGGRLTTFNISTAAAFLVAAEGVPVAKHGNRSYRSKCGSADVLEALGVDIALEPSSLSDVLERVGLGFLFAPNLHPAMRHLVGVRRELGVATIMNLLGPLTNPARVRRQVVGVSDPALLPLVGQALAGLGHLRALVVHGEPGLDELSPLGITRCMHVEDGGVHEFRFDPVHELGWDHGFDASELAGGEPAENAALIEALLAGKGPRAARAAVLLNAAAGLYVAGRADSLRDGVGMAESALDEGRAAAKLEELRNFE